MNLPSITIMSDSEGHRNLDTAEAQDLADSYTESELNVIAALLQTAAQRVRDAQFLLDQKLRPVHQPIAVNPVF